MPTALLLALLSAPASAQDCDGRALEREVINAPPAAMADAFVKLADCDPARARKVTGTHLSRMVADKTAIPAIVAALELGAEKDIRAWLDEETPDTRSRLIAKLGDACDQSDAVSTYFVNAHTELGDDFFDQRWHRGLDACRTDEVRALLRQALDSATIGRSARSQSTFFSVLEVYSRNVGRDAVQIIGAYLEAPRNDEEATLLVNAFGDAARVGSRDGMDAETAELAAKKLAELVPNLPPRAVERARGTLAALGAQAQSDSIAKYAWPEAYANGAYTYGVAVVEDITCRNTQKRAVLHTGTLTEGGDRWPDQVREHFEAKVLGAWAPGDAAKCKGESTVTAAITDEPVTPEALATWLDEQTSAFEGTTGGYQKAWTVGHGAVSW